MTFRTITTILFCLSLTVKNFAAKDPALYYINTYADIAKKEMQRSGIPASIKLAQALLESESGKSPLAKEGNNHFGIKCGKEWQGKTYYKLDDDADEDGNTIESCFRAFDNAEESFIAHTDFLKDPRKAHRYGFLFDIDRSDYRSWAVGLRNAGYASDPTYPHKLIRIIEKYELYKFDGSQVIYISTQPQSQKEKKSDTPVFQKEEAKSENNTEIVNNRPSRLKTKSNPPSYEMPALKNIEVNKTKAVLISQNISVENIAKLLNKKTTEIIAYNELLYGPDQIVFEGTYIYTSLKNKDYTGQEKTHVIKKGDTLEAIANMFGIRANTLYSLNRIPKGNQPLEGETINLKEKVDKKHTPKFTKESRPSRLLFSMN
jgi:LysM repeat protein